TSAALSARPLSRLVGPLDSRKHAFLQHRRRNRPTSACAQEASAITDCRRKLSCVHAAFFELLAAATRARIIPARLRALADERGLFRFERHFWRGGRRRDRRSLERARHFLPLA